MIWRYFTARFGKNRREKKNEVTVDQLQYRQKVVAMDGFYRNGESGNVLLLFYDNWSRPLVRDGWSERKRETNTNCDVLAKNLDLSAAANSNTLNVSIHVYGTFSISIKRNEPSTRCLFHFFFSLWRLVGLSHTHIIHYAPRHGMREVHEMRDCVQVCMSDRRVSW